MKNPTSFLDIPISKGTQPDWVTRLGYPKLLNLFVGESGFVYCTAGLAVLAELPGVRAIWYSLFNNGVYIAVTQTAVYRVTQGGTISLVAGIQFSGQAVQIDENLQNQIIIVDGRKGYVYSQQTNNFVVLNETDNGFVSTNPISVVVLNTFAIVLDGTTGGWYLSDPNNALNWPVLDNVPTIESQLTKAISLETLDNNLYIFGLTGIERWIPNFNTNVYLFPFSRDNNFRTDFGAVSTNCVIRGAANNFSRIYFLSSQFVPMALTTQGITRLPEKGNPVGIARIISQYADVYKAIGSFYSFRGNYFYHLTFPETAVSWVYTQNSDTFLQSDDLIVSAAPNQEVVAINEGMYNLSLERQYKHRQFISERVTNYKGQENFRNLLNGVEAKIVQGELQTTEPQYLNLTLSIDSESWLNSVARTLGRTGKRNAIVEWRTSVAAYEFTFKLDYYGTLDFTLEKLTATIR